MFDPGHRRIFARAFMFSALVLLGFSAYSFQPASQVDLLDEAAAFMLVGGLCLWVAFALDPSINPPRPILAPAAPRFYPLNGWLLFPGLVFLAVLVELNTRWFGLDTARSLGDTRHLQFALLIAGLPLTVSGLAGIGRRSRRIARPHSQPRRPPNSMGDTQPVRVSSQLPVPSSQSSNPVPSGSHPSSLIPRPSLLNQVLRPVFSVLSTQYSVLLLITLFALAVRLWSLGTAVHKFVDELHFSTAAISLLVPGAYFEPDGYLRLFAPFSGITAFPWLFPYLQAGAVAAFGRDLAPLRLVSVIFGTLTIPAVYMLGRAMFDRRIALVAALLLAAFPPHIHFSRIALNNIVDPLFGTLALAFLVSGLRHRSRRDFALSGAALGLAQYFYEGGRLLYPALIVATLVWHAGVVLVRRAFAPRAALNREARLPSADSLVTLLLTVALVVLPLYATLSAIGEPLDARFRTVGIGGSYWLKVQSIGLPQTVEQHLALPFLVYVHQPEIALYYAGEQPMILPYLVPFFLVGVFWLLRRPESPGFMLLVWLLITSVGNMLMTESAVYARYVVAFPAIALILAVALCRLIEGLRIQDSGLSFQSPVSSHQFSASSPPLPATEGSPYGKGEGSGVRVSSLSTHHSLLITLLTLFFAAAQVSYYFGPHLERYNQQLRPFYDCEDAIFRAAALPPGTNIHIVSAANPGTAYLAGVLGYLTSAPHPMNAFEPWQFTTVYLDNLQREFDHAFFIEPDDYTSLQMIQSRFTLEGPFGSPFSVPDDKQLMLYYARASTNGGEG